MARHSGAGSVADMDRLKVLCFAGTYGLALVCELRGWWFAVRSAGI